MQARRVTTLGLLVAFAMSLLVFTSAPAEAVDSNCYRGYNYVDRYQSSTVFREGAGFTAWRIHTGTTWRDKCDHGSLSLAISFNDANVSAKGGYIAVDSVQYLTSTSPKWRQLRTVHLSTADTTTFTVRDGGHLDLSRATRVTKVRIHTHLYWVDEVNSDGSPKVTSVYAAKTVTISLPDSKRHRTTSGGPCCITYS